MSITYKFVGHATHFFTVGAHTILVDPYYTDNPATEVSADDVEADFIIVTHGHFDHVTDLVDIAQRTGAKVIASFELVGWLAKQGIPDDQMHPQNAGGGFQHAFGHLKMTIAQHGGGLPDGSYAGVPAGFILSAEDKKIYVTGDTALTMDLQLYAHEGIDLCIMPIGDNFTMGPDDALLAVKFIRPKAVVPCHYNTWPPIEQDADAWAKRVEAETDAKAHVLKPGETLTL